MYPLSVPPTIAEVGYPLGTCLGPESPKLPPPGFCLWLASPAWMRRLRRWGELSQPTAAIPAMLPKSKPPPPTCDCHCVNFPHRAVATVLVLCYEPPPPLQCICHNANAHSGPRGWSVFPVQSTSAGLAVPWQGQGGEAPRRGGEKESRMRPGGGRFEDMARERDKRETH